MDNYSLSDLAAVTGGEGLGGNSAWVLILLFVLIFGLGGNGFGRQGELGQYATAASQQEVLFGQQFQNLNQAINKVGDGLCSSTYALNNSINGVQENLGGAISNVRYEMATQNASTQAAIHAEGEQTRAMIQQNKIETLQNRVAELSNQLSLQNAMCGIPKVNPYLYGITPNCCGCNNI